MLINVITRASLFNYPMSIFLFFKLNTIITICVISNILRVFLSPYLANLLTSPSIPATKPPPNMSAAAPTEKPAALNHFVFPF